MFTVWEQITVHDGWKVLSDETAITQRLLMRNGTHISMSEDSPFIIGCIVEKIRLDGDVLVVEEMVQCNFLIDR